MLRTTTIRSFLQVRRPFISRYCTATTGGGGGSGSPLHFVGRMKPLAITTVAIGTSLVVKKPVLCQPVYTTTTTPSFGDILNDRGNTFRTVAAAAADDDEVQKSLFHKGELSFGVVLGFCTGYLIKKVGKIFALMVGAGFMFLQYLSFQGFITVHWDRLEGRYKRGFGVDKDGRVTQRDVRTRWTAFVNFLTHDIQFKSTFIIGLYTGIRYG